MGQKIDELNIQQGAEYELELDFEARQWNDRYFLQASCWKATPTQPMAQPAPAPQSAYPPAQPQPQSAHRTQMASPSDLIRISSTRGCCYGGAGQEPLRLLLYSAMSRREAWLLTFGLLAFSPGFSSTLPTTTSLAVFVNPNCSMASASAFLGIKVLR